MHGSLRSRSTPLPFLLPVFLLIAGLTAPLASQAQPRHVLIDVKTTLEEKAALTAVKHGVISAITSAPWSSIVDVGEDYSLWITDERLWRDAEGQIAGDIILELRTPAMVTRGDFITNRRARFRFSPARVETAARQYRPAFQRDVQTFAQDCRTTQKFLSAVATMQTGGVSLLSDEVDFCDFLIALLEAFQPDPIDLVVANEVGGQTLVLLRDMLGMPPRAPERPNEASSRESSSGKDAYRDRQPQGSTLYVLTTRASSKVPVSLLERLDVQTEQLVREAGFEVPRKVWERSTGHSVLRVHYQLQENSAGGEELVIRVAHLEPTSGDASEEPGREGAYRLAWDRSARVPADLSAERRAQDALQEMLEAFLHQW